MLTNMKSEELVDTWPTTRLTTLDSGFQTRLDLFRRIFTQSSLETNLRLTVRLGSLVQIYQQKLCSWDLVSQLTFQARRLTSWRNLARPQNKKHQKKLIQLRN